MVWYSSWDGLFHIFMNTQRERMHKDRLKTHINKIIESWGCLKIVSCEYDKEGHRVLTLLTCSPFEEFRDIMKELCELDDGANGIWSDRAVRLR